MYVPERTWLERGPSRYRGSTGLGSIVPGNQCYDPSHDPNLNHCGTFLESFGSVVNPFATTTVTACSQSETDCMGGPSPLGGSTPPTAPIAPPSAGIPPGSPCYDASHDGGQVHCVSAANVIAGAMNPFGPQQTTTCSAAEIACLQTAGPQTPPDMCATSLGMSCSTLLMGVGVMLLAITLLPALMGARR